MTKKGTSEEEDRERVKKEEKISRSAFLLLNI